MIKVMKYIIIVLLHFAIVGVHASNLDSLVIKANNAYNHGLYDSALATYQKVIDFGYESGELYYNMGNAYYKNNDVASAILYYEKAKKIMPNDESIDYNLNIANSMIVDKIENVPDLFYKNWWNFFYNAMGANAWAIFALISTSLLVIAIGLFIVSRSRQNRKLSFYIALLFLIITTMSSTLAYQKYHFSIEQNEGIVFIPSITVKSSPTQNAVDLFVIHEGTKVKIIDKIDNWIEIKINDGSKGWLPQNSIKEI
jgi:tetratricopeptide (TPR) repeat protein